MLGQINVEGIYIGLRATQSKYVASKYVQGLRYIDERKIAVARQSCFCLRFSIWPKKSKTTRTDVYYFLSRTKGTSGVIKVRYDSATHINVWRDKTGIVAAFASGT